MTSKSASKRSVELFHDGCHTSTVLEFLNHQRKEGLFCDVTVVTGDTCIPAHRCILAACSHYFKAMFTVGLNETYQNQVRIECEAESMKALVGFAYTSSININEDNVQSLLSLANLLQVTSVKNACCDYMSKCLHPANCLAIKHFAAAHDCIDLEKQALRFSAQHFEDLLAEEEFDQISFLLLTELLEHSDLDITQNLLLQGILKWAASDLESREMKLDLLLSKQGISRSSTLFKNLSQMIIPSGGPGIGVICPADGDSENSQENTAEAKEVLLAIGGESVGVSLSSSECLIAGSTTWSHQLPLSSGKETHGAQIADMKKGRSGMAIVATDNIIFVIGGMSSVQPLDSVECYNTRTNTWSNVEPLTTKRNGAGATVIADCIYVVGGCDGKTYLNTVELYDLNQKQWTTAPPMKSNRSFCETVAVGGFIYAVGGSGRVEDGAYTTLNSVERYDPNLKKWANVANMHKPRAYLASAAVDGKIYVAGGNDGEIVINSLERYDPCTNQWTFLSKMKTGRMGFSMVNFCGDLYVTGGFDGRGNSNGVEKYNIDKNTWQKTHSMLKRRYCLAVTVVRFTNKMLKTLNII